MSYKMLIISLLIDYLPKCWKEKTEKKDHFNTLSKYLQCFDETKRTLKEAHDNILNAFLYMLRLQKLTIISERRGKTTERYYTRRDLLNKIKSMPADYCLFREKLYDWSFSLVTIRNYAEVYVSIKEFIANNFSNWFELTLTTETKDFLGEAFDPIIVVSRDTPASDTYSPIYIDIGTVHSAKGQTHCATMYVKTSFHTYETEKLKVKAKGGKRILNNPLFKREHEYNNGEYKRAKEAIKMMYVDFSRPTHLLCFACLKENVCDDIELFKDAGWEIVDITEDSQK